MSSTLSPDERDYIVKAAQWSREHPKEITADDMRRGFDLARLSMYSGLPALRKRLPHAVDYHFGAEVYGSLLALSCFEVQFGTIRRYEAFEALMVALLGEAVVPLLPSLFLATALHPWIGPHMIDINDAVDMLREPDRYRR